MTLKNYFILAFTALSLTCYSNTNLTYPKNDNPIGTTSTKTVAPIASFMMAPPMGCSLPADVFFTNLSSGADSFLWDFGDLSALSSEANPTHAYTDVGTFTITLTATNTTTGIADTTTEQIIITDTTTDFSGTPVFGCAPLQVDFTDNSIVNGGAIINWNWDFGDGGVSTDQNPSYIYDQPGLYTVTLSVTTDNGCQNTLTRNNYVTAIGPLPDFHATPIAGNAPLTVDFTDDTVFLANADSWLWDFGNGDTSTEQNPTYTYTSGCGDFDVTLTVVDQNGCSRSKVKPAFISLTDNMLDVECPEDFTVGSNENCQFVMGDYSSSITVTGNCSDYTYLQTPPPGTAIDANEIPVTIFVSDGINSVLCQFNITVIDQTAPTLSCPGNQFENFNENCELIVPDYTSAINATDNCDTDVTIIQTPPPGTIITSFTEIIFSATDSSGNTGTCSFFITPIDDIFPVITCPEDQTETADANCQFRLPDYTIITTATDNCGSPLVTQSPAPGTYIGLGTTVVTISATDGSNTSRCDFNVEVLNGNILTVNCPPSQLETVDNNCEFVVPDYTLSSSFSGNCGSASLSQNPSPGTVVNSGIYNVIITATDGAGSETCEFTLTVRDVKPPTIICPEDQVENANGSCEFILPNYILYSTTADDCGVTSITQSPAPGTLLTTGVNPITLTASDGFNTTSCTFNVTIVDNTPPEIICLNNQQENANSDCQFFMPDYIPQTTVFDNCNNNPTITQDPPAGTEVSLGDTVVTIIANDGVNVSECQFTVTVLDATPPSLICPETQTRIAVYNCAYTIEDFTGLVVTADGCTTPIVTQSPPQGTLVSPGTYEITITSSDGINASQCEFTLQVIDENPPTINCPNDLVEASNENCELILPDYSNYASTTDDCGVISISQIPEPGTIVPLGNTLITLTASDGFNATSCTFNITVQDNTAPEIICLEDQQESANSNCQFFIPNYISQTIIFDNCSNNPTITQSPPAGTEVSIGDTVITIMASDGINDSECQFTVTVNDVTPPTISCPETQTRSVTNNCQYIVEDFTALVATADACTTPIVTQSPPQGALISTGNHLVVITSSDGVNSNECSFILEVIDDIPPVINLANIVVQLDENGNAQITPDDINAGCSDNCGIADISIDITDLDCSHIGEVPVTLTVTDINQNTSIGVSTITVISNANPNAVCQNITVVLDENGIGTIDGIDLNGGSSGACLYTASITTFTCEDIGTPIEVILTIANTDDPGTDSCTALVHVVDAISPTIICPSETLTIAALAPYELPDFAAIGEVTVLDNCAEYVNYTQYPEPGSYVEAGETEITVTATDPSQNEMSCTFMIFVDPALNAESLTTINSITLFPNPALDEISISNPSNILIQDITILDMGGRIVQQQSLNSTSNDNSLSISKLASATYFVSIVTENGNKMIQLIKH
ncbi:hyalin repeat protein [unidentified eubacterium SCB49]|nr:hyalin repeat protein [unidentified eubacterium SCB49]